MSAAATADPVKEPGTSARNTSDQLQGGALCGDLVRSKLTGKAGAASKSKKKKNKKKGGGGGANKTEDAVVVNGDHEQDEAEEEEEQTVWTMQPRKCKELPDLTSFLAARRASHRARRCRRRGTTALPYHGPSKRNQITLHIFRRSIRSLAIALATRALTVPSSALGHERASRCHSQGAGCAAAGSHAAQKEFGEHTGET
jgi:hypothetical protein